MIWLCVLALAVSSPNISMVVPNDHGGSVLRYIQKKQYAEKQGWRVEFTGDCYSACTLFLGIPREKLCVRDKARFGFHKPMGPTRKSVSQAITLMMREYPGWVRSWIRNNGGLTGRLKIMPKDYVLRHVRKC